MLWGCHWHPSRMVLLFLILKARYLRTRAAGMLYSWATWRE